ncbi:AraC family transcriptional regulator [Leucobacter japonicus]|uniref:AraC family transcriptional regulator n=1 Tax=Leucobacter japonicus TaxID=1461259 RepID=UPI0006A76A01|nr:AraC family transcriptional regulator [Leucobacter japonicus]
MTYNSVTLTPVRSGTAILYRDFGDYPVGKGNAAMLGTNIVCGIRTTGHLATITICLDTDYVLDQLLLQYINILRDRLDAQGFAEILYPEPAQILHLGGRRTSLTISWLDELVALSVDGAYRERCDHEQALWYPAIDQVAPFIRLSAVRTSPLQRALSRPTPVDVRPFTPLRVEAHTVKAMPREDPFRRWTLDEFAELVHLSSKQLVSAFCDVYAKTLLTYQTTLQGEKMAVLLRSINVAISETGRQVGWHRWCPRLGL